MMFSLLLLIGVLFLLFYIFVDGFAA